MRVLLFLIVVCHALDADSASVKVGGPRAWWLQHKILLDEARALQQTKVGEDSSAATTAEPLVTWYDNLPQHHRMQSCQGL